jgi:hypothetical protein
LLADGILDGTQKAVARAIAAFTATSAQLRDEFQLPARQPQEPLSSAKWSFVYRNEDPEGLPYLLKFSAGKFVRSTLSSAELALLQLRLPTKTLLATFPSNGKL